MKIVRLTRTRTRSLDIAIAATEVAGTQGDGEAGFGRASSGLVESRYSASPPPSTVAHLTMDQLAKSEFILFGAIS